MVETFETTVSSSTPSSEFQMALSPNFPFSDMIGSTSSLVSYPRRPVNVIVDPASMSKLDEIVSVRRLGSNITMLLWSITTVTPGTKV
jgi:hypothetical protein